MLYGLYNIKNMSMIKNKKSKKPFLIAVGIVLIIVIGVAAYLFLSPKSTIIDGVNYAPPTEEEKQSANDQKDKNVEREDIDKTPASPTGKTINLIVSDANQYGDTVEVRAFSRDVFENGGTCTVTFTKDSFSLTTQSQAFADASTTQCGAIDTPRSKFDKSGSWSYELVYSSATSKGSASGTVEVK